jgi:hypothetical protein
MRKLRTFDINDNSLYPIRPYPINYRPRFNARQDDRDILNVISRPYYYTLMEFSTVSHWHAITILKSGPAINMAAVGLLSDGNLRYWSCLASSLHCQSITIHLRLIQTCNFQLVAFSCHKFSITCLTFISTPNQHNCILLFIHLTSYDLVF